MAIIEIRTAAKWKVQESSHGLYLGKVKIAYCYRNGIDRNYPMSAKSAIDGESLGDFADEDVAKKECETYLKSFIQKLEGV